MEIVKTIRDAENTVLRENFSAFITKSFHSVNPGTALLPNWHIDIIAEYLEAARRSEITRLIINMPPRALKSLCVSVAWPAYLLGKNPATRVMAASYASSLSIKHAQDSRLLLQEEWFRNCFPECRILSGQNDKQKVVTTKQGFRFATSVGGTATGEGGDILIVDDPQHPLSALSRSDRHRISTWFDQTFSTRLNDKRKGRIVIVMQRLHVDDLSGHLLEKGEWEHLCLPALCEQPQQFSFASANVQRMPGDILHAMREPQEILERAKCELGEQAFLAQYQQSPVASGGMLFKSEWIRRYSPKELPSKFDRIVQSWDTAIKAGNHHDASACITFGEHNGNYFVLSCLAERLEYPELKRLIISEAEQWAPDAILIEDKASGQSLLQDLRRETALPLIAILPHGDKITRAAAVSPLVEAGRVFFSQKKANYSTLENELLNFPYAPHDDTVDAFSQFLNWTKEKNKSVYRMRRL
jgi:predicted phage terminase large subunit-like protein